MMARKDIDVVMLAVPDHWHGIIATRALEAGKDLYLQKPMTLHLGESLAVRNAVKRHGVISQVGTTVNSSMYGLPTAATQTHSAEAELRR